MRVVIQLDPDTDGYRAVWTSETGASVESVSRLSALGALAALVQELGDRLDKAVAVIDQQIKP